MLKQNSDQSHEFSVKHGTLQSMVYRPNKVESEMPYTLGQGDAVVVLFGSLTFSPRFLEKHNLLPTNIFDAGLVGPFNVLPGLILGLLILRFVVNCDVKNKRRKYPVRYFYLLMLCGLGGIWLDYFIRVIFFEILFAVFSTI